MDATYYMPLLGGGVLGGLDHRVFASILLSQPKNKAEAENTGEARRKVAHAQNKRMDALEERYDTLKEKYDDLSDR